MFHLRLIYLPDDQHCGELKAIAEGVGFRGHGAAWFNRSALDAFAEELTQYPIPQGQPIVLKGGEGICADGSLVSVNLGLSISPYNSLGSVRADIELAHTVLAGGPSDLPLRASLAFLTTYADLEAFSREVAAMLDNGGQAMLLGQNDG